MNHCFNCNSSYEMPGTCNCYALGGKREARGTWDVSGLAVPDGPIKVGRRYGKPGEPITIHIEYETLP